MGLDKVLAGRNVDGRIYLCDVREWLGWEQGSKKAEELREKLEEMEWIDAKANG